MKTNATKLKWRILGFLMFLLPIGAMAQTPTAYLCGAATVTLKTDFGGYSFVNGDKIVWNEVGGSGSAVTKVFNSNDPNSTFFTTPSNLADGSHSYTAQIVPLNTELCPSDASTPFVIIKLPEPAITLGTNTTVFCTDNSNSKTIVATLTSPRPTAPAAISYVWTATKDNVVVDIATLGSSSGETFTLGNNVPAGAYVFKAEASYNTNGIQILPAGSCKATSTQAITITTKPGTPAISIAP